MKKNIIIKIVGLFLSLYVLFSCEYKTNIRNEDIFIPNIDVEYYSVKYKKDSIVIAEKAKIKKYEYRADTTIFKGIVTSDKTIVFVKKNGEYYLNQDGYSELFMSNMILYSDSTYCNSMMNGLPHSIKIREVKDSLYESTLYFNLTETHRNPLLVLLYDHSYRIRNIKYGSIFVDYTIQE